jgi:pimeloyl-ACP methyl ester carboxylesterase/membrane protein DedA with SNARE-associated domain
MTTLRRRALFLYLIVLPVSWIVMSLRVPDLPASPGWEEILIRESPAVSAPMRFRKLVGSDATLTPALFLHGSPMASACFDALLEKLPRDRTYYVPDLPGFGASRTGFADPTFVGHAEALRQLVDSENLSLLHLVVYSQGGGPGLILTNTIPGRIRSVVLLSSIGVQEQELTGDYLLNHLIHGVQFIALEVARWTVPHFGLLDDFLLNTQYAANFYDSDMRPLREMLATLAVPTLIVQGDKDRLVRPSAAVEHHRIVPQSELLWIEGGGHLALFTESETVAPPLLNFWRRVEAGTATDLEHADPARLARAAEGLDPTTTIRLSGASLWMTLLGIGFATLASEDLTCLGAGLLAARGLISLPAATLACLIGIWVGDLFLYAVGRSGGRWLVSRAPLRWFITPAALDSASVWLRKRGGMAIIATRFLPGTRLPLYLATGVVRYPLLPVMGWFLVAGLMWSIPIVSLTAIFGEVISDWVLKSTHFLIPLVLASFAFLWLVLRLVTRLSTHAGRRLLRADWERFQRWEFWPRHVFYPPLALSILAMGVRRRSLFAFTAANPGIPHGGLVGESKIAILEALEPSGSVGRFIGITPAMSDRTGTVRRWRDAAGLDLPLVVKPDVGERGNGVVIVRTEAELDRELAGREEAFLVQEFLPGLEFGVFYLRYPDAESGEIFSITKKILTSVRGDGQRCLRDLILDDDRASLSYRHFFDIHQSRLEEIFAQGEEITLAGLGSHCRGSLFLDGNELASEALTREMERISRHFEGFYFGRFDLRCPDEAALQRGEGIRIIELNGVSSEAVHIYHPGTPLLTGYRVLVRQWRHAYDIGLANRTRGARVSTIKELFHLFTK